LVAGAVAFGATSVSNDDIPEGDGRQSAVLWWYKIGRAFGPLEEVVLLWIESASNSI
jgi:hypothetical protein